MAHEMWEVDHKSANTILEILRREPDAKALREDDLHVIVRPVAALELRHTAADFASANGKANAREIIAFLRRTTAFHLVGEADAATIIQLGIVNREGLRTIQATDLMATKYSEPEWTVPGIMAEGVTILAGRPKIGKSWMALGISLAVASGGMAVGSIPVKRGRVLYLSLDDRSDRRIQRRIKKLTEIDSVPDLLEVKADWPRFDFRDRGLEELDAWLMLHPDTRLTVIDTLGWVKPIRSRGGDPYTEDHAAMAAIGQLSERRRISILVVHHLRKADAHDPLDMISGTHGLSGTADGILIVTGLRGSKDKVLHVTGRDVEEQEKAIRFDPASCSWTILGDAEDVRRSEERKAVIRVLGGAREPLSPKDIADELCEEVASVRMKLSRMWNAGEIDRPERGQYRLKA
ncbi:MAG: AAA family ATPase [Planctomycetota bacterium]|nr:AAA family ATPase [Planctomycetota bacterium]